MTISEAIIKLIELKIVHEGIRDSMTDVEAKAHGQEYVDALDCAMQCLSEENWNKCRTEKEAYQQGRAEAIDEFVDRICEDLGIEDATKYGNKNDEQRHNSYSTYMCYEIKDSIDDVAEQMKEKEI